jgi:hypothetical protein
MYAFGDILYPNHNIELPHLRDDQALSLPKSPRNTHTHTWYATVSNWLTLFILYVSGQNFLKKASADPLSAIAITVIVSCYSVHNSLNHNLEPFDYRSLSCPRQCKHKEPKLSLSLSIGQCSRHPTSTNAAKIVDKRTEVSKSHKDEGVNAGSIPHSPVTFGLSLLLCQSGIILWPLGR